MPMQYGKLENISGIDFTLPSDNPLTSETLSAKNNSPLAVYVGPPEWGLKEWVGKTYPPGTKAKDFFQNMTRSFNTVEFNSLFYSIPSLEKVIEWKEKVTEGFKFCPKFPKSITHDRKLVNVEKETEAFCNAIFGFGSNLGRAFMQFSENYQPSQLNKLEKYLRNVKPANLPLSVELRSEKWFSDKVLWQDTCTMFQSVGVGTMITDTAGRRDVIHMTLTDNSLMLRFLANDLEPSAYSRTDEWCFKIKDWIDQGLRTIYIFVHTHDNIHVPELARYWVRKLNEVCGLNLEEPKSFDSPE